MAEPLKNFFDVRVVGSIAADITRVHPSFDARRFTRESVEGLEALSLTGRAGHLTDKLRRYLPDDFEAAAQILVASLGPEHASSESFGLTPFRYLPYTLFVARYGLDHFETSMQAQYELTKRFTAEGSIRPFLEKHPKRTYSQLVKWCEDPNVHVRRLVSEGTRPRLPWATRLPAFQRDPEPVIALLERLKDDPERYVQRSVANNLNDIAKDHPGRVAALCKGWSKNAPEGRSWIVKHALRSLIKQGKPQALAIMGIKQGAEIAIEDVSIIPKRVRIGDRARVSFDLVSTSARTQDLLVDFAVHFKKANGENRPKVFKLKRLTLAGKQKQKLELRVSFAPLTTRKPYPGSQPVELLVNGKAFALGTIEVSP